MEEEELTISEIIKAISKSDKPSLKYEVDQIIGQEDPQSHAVAILVVAKTTSSAQYLQMVH